MCVLDVGEWISPLPPWIQLSSFPTYKEWLLSCLHSGHAAGLQSLGLPESALDSGIQSPADGLGPST